MAKRNLDYIKNGNMIKSKDVDMQWMNIVKVSNKGVNGEQKNNSMLFPAAETQLIFGFPTLPELNLKFNSEKTISDLNFVNFYTDKSNSGGQNDIKSIDSALDRGMSDKNLNNVIIRYYPGHDKINSTFKGSEVLPGNYPNKFFKDDVHNMILDLYYKKKFDNYDFDNTVFNYILPSKTMLNSNFKNFDLVSSPNDLDGEIEKKSDSSEGLGGFQGLVYIP
jgi:hypothetical protein